MTYGLYIKDEQSKLLLDGSKIFTSWNNTMSDNCDYGNPASLYFKLPSEINNINNINLFMMSLNWRGYRLHNTFTSSNDITIGASGNHTHRLASSSTSCNTTAAYSSTNGTSTTTGILGNSTPSHTHGVPDRYQNLPAHTHSMTINLSLDLGDHQHSIGEHGHSVNPSIYDYPIPTSAYFTLHLNNNILLNPIQISNYSIYRNIALYDHSFLNLNNFNEAKITLTTTNAYARVQFLYYIQCYVDY